MTKTVRVLANVPVRVKVSPDADAAASAALADALAPTIAGGEEFEAPMIGGGGGEDCSAMECCFVQLPVTLVLEVKIKAECRVKDIICGKPQDC